VFHNPDLAPTLRCLLVGLLLCTAPSLVSGQAPAQEKIELLKRAVVIVTTDDELGTPLLQGSGFFIARDRIVTAMHVIKHAGRIRIKTIDGKTSTVQTVIAADERSDLALLQIDAPCPDATILQLEKAAPLEGEAIIVLSNPQGFPWKVTRGQVGLTWEFGGFGERMQITASILPGSSGGPVVNEQGRVVGIADMHILGAEDLNFAVPVESLKALQTSASVASVLRSALGR
jgi:S1-C subfamily serine protease